METKTALEMYKEIVEGLIQLSKDNGENISPIQITGTAIEILKIQHSQNISSNW